MFILDVDITMFSQLIRGFFATIDSAVYGFIAIVYNLIEDLANTSILSMTDMNEFASRIYALLGIFMTFFYFIFSYYVIIMSSFKAFPLVSYPPVEFIKNYV